jgi:hypothetical protein
VRVEALHGHHAVQRDQLGVIHQSLEDVLSVRSEPGAQLAVRVVQDGMVQLCADMLGEKVTQRLPAHGSGSQMASGLAPRRTRETSLKLQFS